MNKWIIPLTMLIVFEGIADVFAKNWSLQKTTWIAVASLLSYLIANSFWLLALKNGSGLGRGAIVFSVASAVIAVVLSLFFYKESVSRIQIIGFCFGLLSLVLIFWE